MENVDYYAIQQLLIEGAFDGSEFGGLTDENSVMYLTKELAEKKMSVPAEYTLIGYTHWHDYEEYILIGF